jgi:hypothetical protein
MGSLSFLLDACLDRAGALVDTSFNDVHALQIVALQARQSIERACTDMIDQFGRAFGPRPLAHDTETLQHVLDVQLAVRQSHAERDLESLGAAVRTLV